MGAQQEKRLLEAIFEVSSNGIIILNDENEIIMSNPKSAEIFGYSESALLGKSIEDLIKMGNNCTNSIQLSPLKGLNWIGINRKGQEFPLQASFFSRKIDNTVYTILNLNKKNGHQKEDFELHLLPRIYHESLNDILIIDANKLRFSNANPGALQAIGYSLEELKEMSPWDLKLDHGKQEFLERLEPILEGKEKKAVFETFFIRKDRTTFPVEIHLQLFQNDHQPVFMETLIDITEKRNSERETMNALIEFQEAERERISKELHDELGQALTAMQLNLNTLDFYFENSKKKSKDILKKLKEILQNSIQELKAISRDLMPSILKNYGLVKALEYLCENFNNTQMQVHLQVYNMEKKLEPSPRVAMYRIAQELINNACKHGKARTVNVQLFRNKENVVLTVEDNGLGFNPMAPKAFNGIGLRNIESRVKALNGKYYIDSAPGKGTSISVEIPLMNAYEQQN